MCGLFVPICPLRFCVIGAESLCGFLCLTSDKSTACGVLPFAEFSTGGL